MSQELKLYQVTNRNTGERHYAINYNAQDACSQAGWLIADCYIDEQKPISKYDKHQRAILFVKIPCHVCSYQFAECKKPDDADCPIRPETPDLNEWVRQTAKAHLCLHVGHDLANHDYRKRLKRVSIDEAINELSSQSPPTPPNPSEPVCQATLTRS